MFGNIYTSKQENNNLKSTLLFSVCSQIQPGITVIVDSSSRYVTVGMRSLAEGMGIPHVSMVDPSFETDSTMSITNVSVNIRPPVSTIINSIRDIVSNENLTNVGIIYDNTFSKSTVILS